MIIERALLMTMLMMMMQLLLLGLMRLLMILINSVVGWVDDKAIKLTVNAHCRLFLWHSNTAVRNYTHFEIYAHICKNKLKQHIYPNALAKSHTKYSILDIVHSLLLNSNCSQFRAEFLCAFND